MWQLWLSRGQTYFGFTEAERQSIESYQEWLFGMVRTGPFRSPNTVSEWLSFGPDAATLTALTSLPGTHSPYAITKIVRTAVRAFPSTRVIECLHCRFAPNRLLTLLAQM